MDWTALHEELEYCRIFDRHEHVRWSLERDVPWHAFRGDAVSEDERVAVYTAALSEFTTLAASHNFLREFADDMDFSSWISIWFYEEAKHHYALRRWLHLLGVAIPAAEIAPRAQPYPVGGHHAATCTMNIVSELRASNWYADMSRTTREPVLAAILRNMAADEARHAVAFATFGKRYVDADRPSALRAVLEMAHFWLGNPAEVKHPADLFYAEAAVDFRIDRVAMTHDALARANAKIFGYLTEMTGIALASGRDIRRALRPFVASRMRAAVTAPS